MQVFDAFRFDNQLDMLEIRLLELNATVDFFIICEHILLPIIVRFLHSRHMFKTAYNFALYT